MYGIKTTTDTKKIPLGDKVETYDVFLIPLEKLKYNLKNGRIFMELKELLKDQDIDLQELMKNDQERYNQEIENLVWASDKEKNEVTKEDIKNYTQIESGVILPDGTVIDGNRRFTCLRKLFNEETNNEKREEFRYFKAAILWDSDKINEKMLKELELKIQFGQNQKVGYKSINFNMSIYDSLTKDSFSINDIAKAVNKTPSAISKIKATGDELHEMLSYIKEPDNLVLAQKLNLYWPLEPFVSFLNKHKVSSVKTNQIKNLFYDHMISIDVSLPTQEFRDNLINKILKNPKFQEDYIAAYEKNYAKIVQKEIISKKSESFLEKIEEFKQSDYSNKIKEEYRRFVKLADNKELKEEPLNIMNDVLELLKNLEESLHIFLEAERSNVEDTMLETVNLLVKAEQQIEKLKKMIKWQILKNWVSSQFTPTKMIL